MHMHIHLFLMSDVLQDLSTLWQVNIKNVQILLQWNKIKEQQTKF